MNRLLLSLSLWLACSAPVLAENVILSWTRNPEIFEPPVCDDVNSANDISGYRVYWKLANEVEWQSKTLMEDVQTTVLTDLAPGTWLFSVTAVDGCANESGRSNEVTKVLGASPVPAPGNFRSEGE